MSNLTLRRLVPITATLLAAATLGLVTGLATTVAIPTPAHAASSIGGTITRSEVIARATNWYNRRFDSDMTYSMSSYTWDGPHTRMYRRDCSGFVDMAWHLGSDPNTQGLDDATYTYPISRSELKPGDLLDDTIDNDPGYPFHAILFGGWENAAKTRFWYYSFGGTPIDKVTGASFSWATLSGHATSQYKALRYHKIVDDPTPPPPAPHGPMYDRTRSATGVWAGSSALIENNNAITRTAAVALPNGTLHGFNLIPGSGTWTRARSTAGTWAANATHVDTNGSVTDIAAAALPDGTLHLFVLVPGSGTWTRARSTAGTWAANATHIDTNGSVIAVSAAGLGDGTLHLTVTVPNAGVWHRYRTTSGSWATNQQIDTNGRIFHTYTAALPDRTMHVGVLVNTA